MWLSTGGVIYGMLYFGLPVLGFSVPRPFFLSALPSPTPKPEYYFGAIVPTPTVGISAEFYASSDGVLLAGLQTQTAFDVLQLSITPTVTPSPSATPGLNYPLSNHLFSFYDPLIGRDIPEIAEVNCGQWNYETKYCDSALRSGEPWELNYFRASACPYALFVERAEFLVVSPDWLKVLFPDGFVCKDTGELVTHPFIDFLVPWRSMPMPYADTPWRAPITLMRIK